LVPDVLAGRWLVPADQNAIVLNTKALREAGAARVGDELTVKLDGKDVAFRLVGVIQAPGPDPFAYVEYSAYGRLTDSVGRAGSVLVVASDPSEAGQSALAAALERRFEQTGLRVASVLRISQEIAEAEASFGILVALLLVMAVLLAVVGGLGLAGTMGLNVIERTRELGVMRAIGASDRHIRQVVLLEGLVIGGVSAAAGSLVGWPIGRLLSDAVGRTFMQGPLTFTYPWGGAALWLALVLVLAAVASLVPAWSATRVSVREALAYE
jgi:putative ABC transport system permease protein